MARTAGRRARTAAALAAAVLGLTGLLAGTSPAAAAPGVRTQDLTVRGTPEPDGKPAELDATLYLPDTSAPAPAVLLAHGFGGSKADLAPQARTLVAEGYVVLAYTARGFGQSGGKIHLDAPAYEVADASRLVDLLAKRPEVLTDAPGDPRVGVAGASYGGALALLLAGTDRRVDAAVSMITWNSLPQALVPQQAVTGPAVPATPAGVDPVATPGVFKRLWAATFFAGSPSPAGGTCGRFAPDLCAAYQRVARTGVADEALLRLLDRSSPARVLGDVRAPTLLVQGEADSLFPLSEADANATGIAATGTPVKSMWVPGGHDGGFDASDPQISTAVAGWLGRYVARDGSAVDTRFEASLPRTVRTRGDRDRAAPVLVAPGLPGAGNDIPVPTATVRAAGEPQRIVSPAGGVPAALTSLPGLGSLAATLGGLSGAGLATSSLSALPGQTAAFQTAPLTAALTLVGSPRVRLQVASSAGDASLFAALYDVAPDGSATLPQQLVAPLRLVDLPPAGRAVDVALPAVVRTVEAGHRLRVVVASTDQAYAVPLDARTYTVSLAGDGAVTLPLAVPSAAGGTEVVTSTGPSATAVALGVAALVLVLAGLALVVARRTRRAQVDDVVAELVDVPLAVRGLGKAYGDGYRAVTDVTFRVERGQVLGLLGPNGAGKTTTLRMLLGLIGPTEGELRVFGHRVRAGAPVLSRLGALVEGPGFLPHLSGLANLQAYWRATGRPSADARLDVALEIAGLGEDIHRRVRTYSHGMRQRLAIAQAMLGLPDVLVLDEPTNGLDPPQIREMRDVLRSYAATGRTVVVSSHLLAEVEATCSHVVVMHRGRLVAQGDVATLVGTATTLVVDVDDAERGAAVAAAVPGARDVEPTSTGLVLRLVGTPRSELVRALVQAGLRVDRVAPQHGLEEAFLSLVEEA